LLLPNAEPVTRKHRIVIVASRRIEPGEEVTYHCGDEYFAYFLNSGGCRCLICRKRGANPRRKVASMQIKRNDVCGKN
jgi:hypothetical protein